jgi:raffinose/stachyose/melibiose transport system permease protein
VRYLVNSVIVSGGATLLALVVSLPCAYAIVVRVNKVTGLIFRVFLTGFAVPIQALMIPLYVEILDLHVYDTLIGLILPLAAFSLPITVLVLVNFLRDVPRSLIDAMSIDGAGPLRILRSLALPISLPAILTISIFDFITAWNNFLFPLILTQSPSSATLPLAVFNFQGNHFGNVPQIMACVTLSAVPLLALYLVARRRIVSGLAAGFGL